MNSIMSIKLSAFIKISLIIQILLLDSCSEKGPNDYDFDYVKNQLCGVYQNTEISWSGLIVDLNGDGIGHRDLDEEFQGCPGYVKDWTCAEVKSDYSKKTFIFDVKVPVYVITQVGGQISPVGVLFMQFNFNANWKEGMSVNNVTATGFSSQNTISVVKIAHVTSVTAGSFEVQVEYPLYDQIEKKLVEGEARYTFKKY